VVVVAHRRELTLGIAIALVGTVLTAHELTGLNLGSYLGPIILIIAGAWVLWHTGHAATPRPLTFHPFGTVLREGLWVVRDEQLAVLFGDISLDLTAARLPEGAVTLSCIGLVGDIDLRVPSTVGVRLSANALLGSIHFGGQRQRLLAQTVMLASPELGQAKQVVDLQTSFVLAHIHITWVS